MSVKWGTYNELEGINALKMATGMDVQESGLWATVSRVLGASLDGLVGTTAVVEVKFLYDV